MEPGIYHDVPFDDYRAIEAINASAVKWGVHSMQHMRAYVDHELSQESEALAFGRAAHCRVFEPERYRIDYRVATPCTAVKGDSNQCGNTARYFVDGEWRCGVRGHAPADAKEETDYVSQGEAERIERIVQALHNADCMQLLRATGWSEATLIFDMFGIRFKSRLDRLANGYTKVIDLKKCQVGKADDSSIEWSTNKYGYDVAAACYCYGVKALTGIMPNFYWVFIEDGPPYAINLVEADEETLRIGLTKAFHTIERWKRAERRNEYTGHILGAKYIKTGGLPAARRREWENAELASF